MRTPTDAQLRAIRKKLLGWFAQMQRQYHWRVDATPLYEQIIAELLLQRTRADVVAAHLPRILRLAPNWRALAAIRARELGAALRPLGLWRRRSVSLRSLAQHITDIGGEFPRDRTGLESLPGVGQYMANVFLVIQGLGHAPYLDVNMSRVLERLFGRRRLSDIRYDPELQQIAGRLVSSPNCQRLNWAILDLAALVCTPRDPGCAMCPVTRLCDYAQVTMSPCTNRKPKRARARTRSRNPRTRVVSRPASQKARTREAH